MDPTTQDILERLLEAYLEVLSDANDFRFNAGCAEWELDPVAEEARELLDQRRAARE